MNLKNISKLFLALVILFPLLTYSQNSDQAATEKRYINDFAYLDKLSKTITGTPPSKEEFRALKQAISDHRKTEFFSTKIDEYLESDLFYTKMVDRVRELFRIPGTNEAVVPMPSYYPGDAQAYQQNPFSRTVYKILKQSKSWDLLFTLKGKTNNSYNYYNNSYEDVSLPLSYTFLNKYPTSTINKNRKRAAVLFRVLLCDTMVPAVDISDALTDQEIQVVLGQNKSAIHSKADQLVDDHGQRADCQGCHSKLDPMARTLPEFPSQIQQRSALVFNAKDGRRVDIPAYDFPDLMNKLTSQKDYVSCQMEHFYEWFIGPREDLTPQRAELFAYDFEAGGRQPKKLIKAMVTSPEFRLKDVQQNSLVKFENKLRATFKQCMSCHRTQEGLSPWVANTDLTKIIDGGLSPQETSKLLPRLKKVLDGTGEVTMPPQYSDWQLTPQERSKILDYIDTKLQENK